VIRAKSSELFLDSSRMAGNRARMDDDDDDDDDDSTFDDFDFDFDSDDSASVLTS